MEFDNLNSEPCASEQDVNPITCQVGSGGGGSGGGGGGGEPDGDVPPSDDDRCADPAFYDANPLICAGYPKLILKPEYALTESGLTVQYSTYVRTNGNEQLLVSGLNYFSSDPNVAIIELEEGLATGVLPGIGTISVTWQNLTAHAQIEVVLTCDDYSTDHFIWIDNSRSSTVGFSGMYSTRLAYAKEAAVKYINKINFSKDKVAIGKFNAAGTLVQELTNDKAVAIAAVQAISSTFAKTSLVAGVSSLVGATGNTRNGLYILFSDGEDNIGGDAIAIAKQAKDAGYTILVVALRAWGTYFNTLYNIASAGFFLSAYPATAQTVIDTLIALKSLHCAGDCEPTPGTSPTASLDYRTFVKWDVTRGSVDLIGLGVWDMLPGNGLYLDMSGTKLNSDGQITSKDEFNFVSGNQYKFSIRVAGNQRYSNENEGILVTIGTLLSQTITPTGYHQDFTLYEFLFTPGANETAKVVIGLIQSQNNNVGPLVDTVLLENLTTATTILEDDFDDENTQVILPGDGTYYGCLEQPPGAQAADPTPPFVLVE